MGYLHQMGCEMLREGPKHTVLFNPANRKVTTVPRHREINEFLAKKICKDLGVPPP